MIERGKKFPQLFCNFSATFLQFLTFLDFPKGFLIIIKKDVKMFFGKSKKGFENPEKVKSCRKVAEKLREFFAPL
jgi:hypothetical protein